MNGSTPRICGFSSMLRSVSPCGDDADARGEGARRCGAVWRPASCWLAPAGLGSLFAVVTAVVVVGGVRVRVGSRRAR